MNEYHQQQQEEQSIIVKASSSVESAATTTIKSTIDLSEFSYEDLAHALYKRGERAGFHKITDKTKWREAIMAEILGHVAFKRISGGRHTKNYGADAVMNGEVINDDDDDQRLLAEYKSHVITLRQIKNLRNHIKNPRTGSRYAALTILGIYNSIYSYEALDRIRNHEHFFGIFAEERCLQIIQPHKHVVLEQLGREIQKRELANKPVRTTNLNTVKINLAHTDLYNIVYTRPVQDDQG